MAKLQAEDADLTLPLMGKAYWIAKAAAPGADRVGLDFFLASFPHRGEVVPEPAAEPRPKSRARRVREAA